MADRKCLYRGVRIAWSVGFGILCLLLIALWLRSYWFVDIADRRSNTLISLRGAVGFYVLNRATRGDRVRAYSLAEMTDIEPIGTYGFALRREEQFILIALPYWILLLVAAIVAAVPWLPWWSTRFSLRTLLIVTTLIAVGLGLAVWLAGG